MWDGGECGLLQYSFNRNIILNVANRRITAARYLQSEEITNSLSNPNTHFRFRSKIFKTFLTKSFVEYISGSFAKVSI